MMAEKPNEPPDSSSSGDDGDFYDAEGEGVSTSETPTSPSASSSSQPSFNQLPFAERRLLDPLACENEKNGESKPLRLSESLPCDPIRSHLMKMTLDYASDEAEDTDIGTASSIEGGSVEHGLLGYRRKRSSKSRPRFSYELDDDALSDLNTKKSKTSRVVASKMKAGIRGVGKVGRSMLEEMKNKAAAATSSHRALESTSVDLFTDSSSYSGAMSYMSSPSIRPFNPLRVQVDNKRGRSDFVGLQSIQELNDFQGTVWCIKWSRDGRLVAVAGQDKLLRVYCSVGAWKHFTRLRNQALGQRISSPPTRQRASIDEDINLDDISLSEEGPLLLFAVYEGHTGNIVDISWSEYHFILSCSLDNTVRVWHISHDRCLVIMAHPKPVTTISFHPNDDRFYISGSIDGKIRLWNIHDKRVVFRTEVSSVTSKDSKSFISSSGNNESPQGLITASTFVQNGKFAVIGTHDGRVIFYKINPLDFLTQLQVRPHSGGNRASCKVTGIEPVDGNKILVTTNDSRIRLYDLRDLSLTCKYKGYVNESSFIRASVSHDHKYIICGSDNASLHIWRLQQDSNARKNRNDSPETIKISNSSLVAEQVTGNSTPSASIINVATFAPSPKTLVPDAEYVILAADLQGALHLFSK